MARLVKKAAVKLVSTFIEDVPMATIHMLANVVFAMWRSARRIGIARALYKQAQVLVLDEATSALDSATEQAVIHSMDRLSNKPTIIMIAHRLSTCKAAIVLSVSKRPYNSSDLPNRSYLLSFDFP